MGTLDVDGQHVLSPPPSLTVLVAVNGSVRSGYAVKWALENFSAEGRTLFRLLHVRPRIKAVPTPMGNYIPISQARADVAAAYKEEMEWKTNKMLLPYKRLKTKRKIEVEVVVVEDDDVPQAIWQEVSMFKIHELVIGASSRGGFMRTFKGQNLSSRISECIPSFCSVYVVSKGEVKKHPSTSEADGSIKDGNVDASASTNTGFSCGSRSQREIQQLQALPTKNKDLILRRSSSSSTCFHRTVFMDVKNQSNALHSSSSNSEIPSAGSIFSSFRSSPSWKSDQTDTSSASSSDGKMHENVKLFYDKGLPIFEGWEKTSSGNIIERTNAGAATQGENGIDEDELADGSDHPTHESQMELNVGYDFLEETNAQSGTASVQPNDPFSISRCTELLFSIPNARLMSRETNMKALKAIRADPTWREVFMSVPHEIRLEMLTPSQLDEQWALGLFRKS